VAISIEQAFRPTLGLTTVGEYELLALIARGGMGTVYLCRRKGDFGFVRLFALKMLHEHLADEGTYISMFLDEARIGARLHHPNIAAAVDLGTFHGAHYVVMDYVEGCSLADLQTRLRGDLPVAAVLHIVIDALEGLQAAHSVTGDDGERLGLVHRDISPGNVLIGVEGTARITDFGVAKLEQAAGARTRSSERKGKFAFMSPEQVLDDEVDHRADLFSMGVVLWNALTGRALFGRRNDGIAIHKVLNMPIARPSSVSDRCPAWLDEVCMRALQRDPDRRYQSASEMSSVIREIAAAEAAGGSPRAVSEVVQRAFAEELESRRLMLRSATTGAKAQATETASRARAVTSLPTFAPLVTESEWTASPLSDARREGLRRRPLLLWLASVGLVALVSAGVLVGARLLRDEGAEVADRGGEPSPPAPETSPPPARAARPAAEAANQPQPAPITAASIQSPAPEPVAEPAPAPGSVGREARQGRVDRQDADADRARSRRAASSRRAPTRGQAPRRERKAEPRPGGDAEAAAASREAAAAEPEEEKAPPTDNVDPWRKR
jgi:serine/threonine-protein kinase